MMRDLEDLLPRVLQYAPACAEPIALDHLRMAAITWCERTRCWREVDEICTKDGELDVLCVPPYSTLMEIEEAHFDGRRLEPAPHGYRTTSLKGGQTRFITQAAPNMIALYPHTAGRLNISMTLKPALDADAIPDFMVEQWGHHLAHGALASILLLPNQPFTSAQMAVYFDGKFQAALDSHFNVSLRGQQRTPVRTRPRF